MKLKSMKFIGVLLTLALVMSMIGATAFADTTSVAVYMNGVFQKSYSVSDLNSRNCYTDTFSSYDCKSDTIVYRNAYGPLLQDVLEDAYGAGNFSTVSTIQFVASDKSSPALSKSTVLNGDYYPGPTDIAPILATMYGNPLDTDNCIRNFYGMSSSDDDVMQYWIKNVYRINMAN